MSFIHNLPPKNGEIRGIKSSGRLSISLAALWAAATDSDRQEKKGVANIWQITVEWVIAIQGGVSDKRGAGVAAVFMLHACLPRPPGTPSYHSITPALVIH